MTVAPPSPPSPTVDTRSGPGRWKGWAPGLFIVALVALAYWPVARAGYIWDDDDHITENRNLRDAGGLKRIWTRLGPRNDGTPQYYPLTHTTFWLEYRLWRLRPLGYHVVNVALHGATAWLGWVLLRRVRVPGAWWVAALWALHPVNVESVAWVTERKNVLSAFFYVLAALAHVRFAGLDDGAVPLVGRTRLFAYVATVVCFTCAVFSKTVAGTFPAAMLLIVFWKRGRMAWRDVAPLLPLFAFALVMGSITGWLERDQVGAVGPEWAFTFGQRVAIAGRAVWFYAAKALWPWPLAFIYPRWEVAQPAAWMAIAPLAVVAVTVGLFAYRDRIGRGPFVAWSFFCGTLFPALGFVNVYPMRYSFVADHFQYLAMPGMLILVVATVVWAAESIHERVPRVPRATWTALGALVLVALVALSFCRVIVFEDRVTLWADTVRKNPRGVIVRNNYASALIDAGRVDDAEPQVAAALALRPDLPQGWYNRGRILLSRGEHRAALNAFRRAAAGEPGNDEIHYQLGVAAARAGVESLAETAWRRAMKLNPHNPLPRTRLAHHLNARAAAEGSAGNLEVAEGLVREALRLEPSLAEAHNNLGTILKLRGDRTGAAVAYRQALKLKPDLETAKKNLAALEGARQ
jgi:Flp pilus assembly protein TadD